MCLLVLLYINWKKIVRKYLDLWCLTKGTLKWLWKIKQAMCQGATFIYRGMLWCVPEKAKLMTCVAPSVHWKWALQIRQEMGKATRLPCLGLRTKYSKATPAGRLCMAFVKLQGLQTSVPRWESWLVRQSVRRVNTFNASYWHLLRHLFYNTTMTASALFLCT